MKVRVIILVQSIILNEIYLLSQIHSEYIFGQTAIVTISPATFKQLN